VPGVSDDAARLRAASTRLRDLLAERDERIAAQKPPPSDGLTKPSPESLRGKFGRKPGRPKGQPGATMELSDHPGRKVRHLGEVCRLLATPFPLLAATMSSPPMDAQT
jgi:hypothetical protein